MAGALADLQTSGVLVAIKNIEATLASGETRKGVRLYLWDDGQNLVATSTADGIALYLVAESETK